MRQHLTLDAHFFRSEVVLVGLGMLLDPNSGPIDEIGGENGHSFLDVNSRGAHLQTMEIENLSGFLDPGFDGLTAILFAKPGRQIIGHRDIAKVS